MKSKKKWLEKIDRVEELLKRQEREKRSVAERIEIKDRGECDVDFFRISYKLAVLDRMRRWVETYGTLTYGFQTMLKHPNNNWG